MTDTRSSTAAGAGQPSLAEFDCPAITNTSPRATRGGVDQIAIGDLAPPTSAHNVSGEAFLHLFSSKVEDADIDRVAEEIDLPQFDATYFQPRSGLQVGDQLGVVFGFDQFNSFVPDFFFQFVDLGFQLGESRQDKCLDGRCHLRFNLGRNADAVGSLLL